MSNIPDDLGFVALVIFFLAIAWLMFRLAAEATTKQEFLASCLCLGGSAAVGLFFCPLVWLPMDQYGTIHEPAWEDTVISGGFAALFAGHVIKSWRSHVFLWAVAAVVLNGLEKEISTNAYLPKFAQTLFHYAALFSWVISAQVWSGSLKDLSGNWFSVKSWNDFKR